jgi:hypothetical protein
MKNENEVFLYNLKSEFVGDWTIDFSEKIPDYIEYEGKIFILKPENTHVDPEGITLYQYVEGLGKRL